MQSATCLTCTRIFIRDFAEGDALPRHLDALLGTPCVGSGREPAFSPTLSFERERREAELPMWMQR